MKLKKIFLYDIVFIGLGVLLLLFFYVLYRQINALNESSDAVTHTNVVKLKLEQAFSALKDAETGQRGYLITRDSVFLSPYEKAAERFEQSLTDLDTLLNNNPDQRERIQALESLAEKRMNVLNTVLTLQSKSDFRLAPLTSYMRQGKYLMDSIRTQINVMSGIEDSLLNHRIETRKHNTFITPLYALILFTFTLLILLLSFFTIRKDFKAQQKLKEEILGSQLFLQSLLDGSNELIAAYNADLRFAVVNKSTEDYYHIRREDVIGKHLYEVFPKLKGSENGQMIENVLKGNPDLNRVVKSEILDQYFENNMVPLYSSEGKVTGVLLIGRDLTPVFQKSEELKKSNEALVREKAFAELLIESSPDMILACDNELRFTVWNKKSEEHSGLTKKDVLGKYAFDVFPEYNNDQWKNLIHEVLKGKALHYPQIKFLHKEGYGESFVIPLRKPDGEIFGLLSITRDISDLVNASESLQQKNEELERSNQELASFSYVASHDLQEPLRKIQSFTGRILEKEGEQFSANTKDYFDRIVSAAKRMQNLIDSLLNFSRTNTTELKFETVDLNILLDEIKSNLKENIEEKKAVIEGSSLPTLPVIPIQFHQLLLNLINNSLKYSKADVPPHIRISADIVKGSDLTITGIHISQNYWKISVEDNGIGFEKQYEHKIFELFQRLHGKTEYSGTGIGLAICKKIVQNHHGLITATGEPGIGAVFNIYLPLAAR